MQKFLALAALVPAALAQTYYGCYTEIPARALTGASLVDYTSMTIVDCEAFCTTGQAPNPPFTLWGVEYGGECYCDNSLAQGSFPAFATDCGMPCPNDPTAICGGPNRLSLYGSSATPPTFTPYPHTGTVTTQVSQGCWTELSGGRALSGASAYSSSLMTVADCGNYCLNEGFLWFGLEYSSECYCGAALDLGSTLATSTDCSMACSGAPGQTCGGPNRLSVYEWQ